MALYSKPGIDDKHVKAFLAAGAPPGIVDATFGPGTYARVSGVDPYVGTGPVQTQTSTLPQTISNKPLYSKTGTDDKHVKAFLAAGAAPGIVDATFGPGTYARVGQPQTQQQTQKPVSSPQMSDIDQQKLAQAMLKPYTDSATGEVDISRAMAEGVSAQVIERAWDKETALSYGVMNKFYDKETGLYDVEAAEKAGVADQIIKAVTPESEYKAFKAEQSRVKAENERISAENAKSQAELDTFKRYHSQNPYTGEWYDNKDIATYRDELAQKTDWDRFTLDQARARIQKLTDAVGFEDAYSQIMATGSKLERQAAIEEAGFRANHIQDPKTNEWVSKDWAKPFIEAGVFKTYKEAQGVFDDGGVSAVNEAISAKAMAQQSAYAMAAAKESSARYEAEKDFFQAKGDTVAYRGDIIDSVLRSEFDDFKARGTEYTIKDTDGPVLKELKQLHNLGAAFPSKGDYFTRDVWDGLSTETQNILLTERARQIQARKEKPILDIVPVVGTIRTVQRHGYKSGWSWLSAGLDATIILSAAGVSAKTAVGAATMPLKPVKAYARLTGFEDLAMQSAKATKYITNNTIKAAQRIENITKANVARQNITKAAKTYGRMITEDTALNVSAGRAGLQEAKRLYGGAMSNARALQMEYIDALKAYDTTAMRRNQLADAIRAREKLGETPLRADDYANLNALREADELLKSLRNRIGYTGEKLNQAGKAYGEMVLEGTGLSRESLKDIRAIAKSGAGKSSKISQQYLESVVKDTALSPKQLKSMLNQLDTLGLSGQKKLSDFTQRAYTQARDAFLKAHKDQKGVIYSEIDRLEKQAASKISRAESSGIPHRKGAKSGVAEQEKQASPALKEPSAPATAPITREQYDQLLKEGLTHDDILRAAEKAGGNEKLFWEEINKIRRLYMAVRYALDKPLTTAEENAVRKMVEEAEKYGKAEKARQVASVKPTPKRDKGPEVNQGEQSSLTWAVSPGRLPGAGSASAPDSSPSPAPFYEPYPDIFPELKPDHEIETAPQHATKPEIQLKPAIQPDTETKPATKPQEQTKTKTETKTKTKGQTAPAPAPAPSPEIKPGPQLKPVPSLKQVLEVKPAPAPGEAPKPKDEEKTPVKTKAMIDIPISPEYAEITELEGVPKNPGKTLWKQGIIWIEASPPSPGSIKKGVKGQVKVLPKAPADAPVKKGTPSKTLFTRGKAPDLMKVRVGFTTATVKRGRSISFDKSPIYLTRSGRKIITHRQGKLLSRKH